MIGFYNYTVILTYLSAVSAIVGMYFSFTGSLKTAVFCIMFSGLCDMFDGAVARTKKDRTEQQKKFGIQIDSLCDCISFGVAPAVFTFFYAYHNGASQYLQIIAGVVAIALMLCAVIRLAFFNVMEEERQKVEGNKRRTFYQGLPVTNVSYTIPLGYLATWFSNGDVRVWFLVGIVALTAFLFVLDFRMVKAHGKVNILLVLLGILIFAGVVLA